MAQRYRKYINMSRDGMHADLILHVLALMLGQNVKHRPQMYVIATSQPFFSILELPMNFDRLLHAKGKYVFMQKTELAVSMQNITLRQTYGG